LLAYVMRFGIINLVLFLLGLTILGISGAVILVKLGVAWLVDAWENKSFVSLGRGLTCIGFVFTVASLLIGLMLGAEIF